MNAPREVVGIIPARFKSSRYPGKPLVMILGKPLVIHVAERTAEALGKENTFVATDDNTIFKTVQEYGFQAIMTSDNHKTGTDRLGEVAQKLPAKIYINVQGDEPLIKPKDILKVAEAKKKYPNKIINAYTLIGKEEDTVSVNIPKVIMDESEQLIYMSRLPVPGIKGSTKMPDYYKQVCIYAFNREDLEKFGSRKNKTYLESFEDIEILRFLEMGCKIQMIRVSESSLAVDVPEDVQKVEQALKLKGGI